MDRRRVPVAATVAAVVLVAILTGPLVNATGFPPDETGTLLGAESGSAEVRVVAAPETLTLKHGAFGADVYYLDGSEARVTVENVDGSPTLVYTVESRDLGFKGVQRTALAGSADESVDIEVPIGRFRPNTLEQDRYNATLTVTIEGTQSQTIFERNVSITVRE